MAKTTSQTAISKKHYGVPKISNKSLNQYFRNYSLSKNCKIMHKFQAKQINFIFQTIFGFSNKQIRVISIISAKKTSNIMEKQATIK